MALRSISSGMVAMQLDAPGQPLRRVEKPIPECPEGEVLIEVSACGVCRTDLHVADGDIAGKLPIVPGHEIVGHVVATGPGVDGISLGHRVGVPWLGHTCGICPYCMEGKENLCDHPEFTGFTRDGGFASHVLAEAAYCLAIPDDLDAPHVAPLLCAGLIGYRSLVMAEEAEIVGVYGFGAAAHILTQIMVGQGRRVFAFTRIGDSESQQLARDLGCEWAGASGDAPPQLLDAALIFAPAGHLVPAALRATRKGGVVVCAGIHMTDIPSFPYRILWEERIVRSVANLTRADGKAFFEAIRKYPVQTRVEIFKLAEANEALDALRRGAIQGAAVICP